MSERLGASTSDALGPLAAPSGGSGTVTSVSVTTLAGVSGSVANATTTPAISITIGALAGEQIVRLSSDVNGATDATSTTLANVTGLSFAVAANEEWYVEVWMHYTAAATTTGYFLTATGPASPTAFTGEVVGTSGASTVQARHFAAYDGGSSFGNSLAGLNFMSGKFFLRNGSNAGTFQVRFASEISSSQVINKAGSFLRARRTL